MQAMTDPIMSEIQYGPRRLRAICRDAERAEISRALMEHSHNRTHAAGALGISRRTLINKIKAYSLTRAACRHYSERPSPLGPTLN
jgi:transcriptional regulator with PAS, ATPase and Fis domain